MATTTKIGENMSTRKVLNDENQTVTFRDCFGKWHVVNEEEIDDKSDALDFLRQGIDPEFNFLVQMMVDQDILSAGVSKHLEISTGHIKETDDQILMAIVNKVEVTNEIMLTVNGHDYGYWVHVQLDIKDQADEYKKHLLDSGFSRNLVNILYNAYAMGCIYVNFDKDGRQYEGIEVFDW